LNSANCPTTGINTVALGGLAWPSMAAVRRGARKKPVYQFDR